MISTLSNEPFPLTSLIEYLVIKSIVLLSLNSFIFWTLAGAPLNSSLLWTSVTFDELDNSIAQSSALSPPPKITTDLSLKIVLSFIEYKTDFPSYFSALLVGNFLGSKEPTPPAITILGVSNSFPFNVLTNHLLFSFFNSWTLSLKWKLKLNGFICSIKLFVSSSPVHLGTAGIS